MKASYEHVDLKQKNSFRVIHLKYPNACGVIWHYHPEYEIVYVVKGRGKRYIGSHTSFYEGTDLVIIDNQRAARAGLFAFLHAFQFSP